MMTVPGVLGGISALRELACARSERSVFLFRLCEISHGGRGRRWREFLSAKEDCANNDRIVVVHASYFRTSTVLGFEAQILDRRNKQNAL
jgi:hypothetical protein